MAVQLALEEGLGGFGFEDQKVRQVLRDAHQIESSSKATVCLQDFDQLALVPDENPRGPYLKPRYLGYEARQPWISRGDVTND